MTKMIMKEGGMDDRNGKNIKSYKHTLFKIVTALQNKRSKTRDSTMRVILHECCHSVCA